MTTAALLIPATARGPLLSEECCWQRASPWTPSLPLHLAARMAYGSGRPARIHTVRVDTPTIPLPPASEYIIIHNWGMGELYEPIIQTIRTRRRPLRLMANPPTTMIALAMRFPTVSVCDVPTMHTEARLPLDAISPTTWHAYTHLLYQLTSGCPMGCPYCVWTPPWRTRSIERVAHEIPAILARLRPDVQAEIRADRTGRRVSLLCNALSGHPSWLRRLHDAIAPLSLTFRSDLDVRNTDRATVETCHAMGLRHATLGIEFLTDGMLAALNKGHTIEQALAVMTDLTDLGITYSFSLRQGVGESLDDLAELDANLREMHRLGLRAAKITINPMRQWPGQSWLPTDAETVNLGTDRYPCHAAQLSPQLRSAWTRIIQTANPATA